MAEGQSGMTRIWDWITFDRIKWVVLLALLALLVLAFWQNGSNDIFSHEKTEKLLTKLSQVDFGRFLITSFVVLIVVIIAGNMAFALFGRKSDSDSTLEKRFLLAKELLTVFIGLLGTLMGFYFAENRVSTENVQKIANTVSQNPPSTLAKSDEWIIIVGTDVSLDQAGYELKKALGVSAAAKIYKVGDKYYTVIPGFASSEDARKILPEAQKKINADSLILDLKTWCVNGKNLGEYVECQSPADDAPVSVNTNSNRSGPNNANVKKTEINANDSTR